MHKIKADSMVMIIYGPPSLHMQKRFKNLHIELQVICFLVENLHCRCSSHRQGGFQNKQIYHVFTVVSVLSLDYHILVYTCLTLQTNPPSRECMVRWEAGTNPHLFPFFVVELQTLLDAFKNVQLIRKTDSILFVMNVKMI